MNEERPSVTAEGAAVMRAIHQTIDDEPKILDDPISVPRPGRVHRTRCNIRTLTSWS